MRRADAYAYRPAEDRQGEKGGHDTQVSMHRAPSPAKAVRSMGARGDMPALPERIACALATTGPGAMEIAIPPLRSTTLIGRADLAPNRALDEGRPAIPAAEPAHTNPSTSSQIPSHPSRQAAS